MRRACRFAMRCLASWVLAGVCLGVAVAAQTESSRAVDVVLVLDNSGSMKANDPNALLRQAVSEFAAQLSGDSRLGLVLFDHRIELVLDLTPVSDASFQSRVSESLRRVDFSGDWTDIPGGIERAIYTLNQDGRPDALHVLVFFTDGIIDTGDRARDLERGRWLRDNLTTEAKQRGIRIFGVAFTDAADYQLIQSVAQTTGGEHYRVLNASGIAGTLARIRARLLDPLPLSSGEPGPVVPVTADSPWTWRPMSLALLAFALLSVGVVWRRRAAAVPAADVAHLIDVGRHTGTDRIALRKRRIRLGRDTNVNDICIAADTISSQHATIEYREGSFILRDLRSSNGTFVNGKQISDPDSVREVMLKSGDRIRFDAYEFVFNLDASAGDAAPGTDNVPERLKTALRRDPAPRPAPGSGANDAQPAGQGAAAPAGQVVHRGRATPAETCVRPEFCTVHPSWKATELCPKCRLGKCKQCMIEVDNSAICRDCAAKTGLTA